MTGWAARYAQARREEEQRAAAADAAVEAWQRSQEELLALELELELALVREATGGPVLVAVGRSRGPEEGH